MFSLKFYLDKLNKLKIIIEIIKAFSFVINKS